MVKNTTGGTKTKGLARKHVKSAGGGGSAALRLPENELEVIVAVETMLGNGMCRVFNEKGDGFIAHIRNKFKGRHKRANLICKNSIILCGYRDWEKPYKNLDVIFIYDDYNINQIRQNPTINIRNLITRITTPYTNTNTNTNTNYHDDDDDDALVFTNIIPQEPIHKNTHTDNNNYNNNYNNNTHNDIDIDIDFADI
jgi:hypothetical protein